MDSQSKASLELIRSSYLFDDGFYRQQVMCDENYGEFDPITHYITIGEKVGLRPNPLFNPDYYRLQAGISDANAGALAHYIEEGHALGHRTHPLFDTEYYLNNNPDVAEVGKNPLMHFLTQGGTEGRKPHPLFHSWNYCRSVTSLASTRENPLVHYLRVGWRDQRHPHPYFDSEYYQRANRLDDFGGLSPLEHFVTVGLAAGLTPHPLFSALAFQRTGADPHRLSEESSMQAACLAPRVPNDDYRALSLAIELGRTSAPKGAAPASDHNLRTIAFYLPQFHRIPENDEHWGQGFTEWVNVRQAKPNFVGHDQPRQPSELGYYDLRDPHVLELQAGLAKEFGLHGFCYYWYWFNGRMPLSLPLEQMLTTGKPNFPFCLCWANETWTRKWAGDEQVILQQTFSHEDDQAHALKLARYFQDSRYLKIGGAPLLLIYRAAGLPELPGYLKRWRTIFADLGVDRVHFALVESSEYAWANHDPRPLGFDSSVEFPPHGGSGALPKVENMLNSSFSGALFDYRETVLRYTQANDVTYPRWRTVMGAWDNTARYQDTPATFINANPGGYRAWLETVIQDTVKKRPPDEQLVFINAWNEWGEGTYLEPDTRWGRAYLEATLGAILTVNSAGLSTT